MARKNLSRKVIHAASRAAFCRFLYELQGGVCPLCKKRLARRASDNNIDHIVPLAKGGTDCRDNLQLTHQHCNEQKGDTLEEDLHTTTPPGYKYSFKSQTRIEQDRFAKWKRLQEKGLVR